MEMKTGLAVDGGSIDGSVEETLLAAGVAVMASRCRRLAVHYAPDRLITPDVIIRCIGVVSVTSTDLHAFMAAVMEGSYADDPPSSLVAELAEVLPAVHGVRLSNASTAGQQLARVAFDLPARSSMQPCPGCGLCTAIGSWTADQVADAPELIQPLIRRLTAEHIQTPGPGGRSGDA